jgi:predicted nucleotidyltransferase
LAIQIIFVSLQQDHHGEYMDKASVISNIKAIASKTLPAGSTLLLYGSRARGDNRADSDWDLLILLDKSKLHAQDYDYGYPFREFGWDIGEESALTYTQKKQWNEWTFLPYHKNVERDKIVLV